MKWRSKATWAWLAAGTGVLAISLLAGCADVAYLGQSVSGHLRLISAARPVDEWLAEPDLKADLRDRLQLSQRMRDFAVSELHLPDNGSYRAYADLHRDAAVWNVVAAPELSLSPRTWCYPVMGCVAYRGYFNEEKAQDFGRQLGAQGNEVLVYPVPAYSSLGWTRDPLLNTFITYPDGALAEMMFHELAHQRMYIGGDTSFDESFATAVGEIGARLWLDRFGNEKARAQYEKSRERSRDFRVLTDGYRQRLLDLYASKEDDEHKRRAKVELMAALRNDYARLKAEKWAGYNGFDHWFEEANNASFALLATYTSRVPAFKSIYEREGRDWERFYAEAKRIGALPPAERQAALDAAVISPSATR